jgi:hypothetical protein
MNRVIVWDIETVPDIKGFAAANGHEGKGDDEIRAAMGDKFLKRIYLSFPKIPSGLVAGPTDHRGVSLGISSHLLGAGQRPRAYGHVFMSRVRAMGIRDRPISPRSPWQNPYVAPLSRAVQRTGVIVAIPILSGLHTIKPGYNFRKGQAS